MIEHIKIDVQPHSTQGPRLEPCQHLAHRTAYSFGQHTLNVESRDASVDDIAVKLVEIRLLSFALAHLDNISEEKAR